MTSLEMMRDGMRLKWQSGWRFQTCFISHNIWDHYSHWLSYFSRWLKPPTSNDMSKKMLIVRIQSSSAMIIMVCFTVSMARAYARWNWSRLIPFISWGIVIAAKSPPDSEGLGGHLKGNLILWRIAWLWYPINWVANRIIDHATIGISGQMWLTSPFCIVFVGIYLHNIPLNASILWHLCHQGSRKIMENPLFHLVPSIQWSK